MAKQEGMSKKDFVITYVLTRARHVEQFDGQAAADKGAVLYERIERLCEKE